MFWAHLETRNFRFDAFGDRESEALDALKRTWQKHARQYEATFSWVDLKDDVSIVFIRQGDGLRDRDLITSANTPRESK